MVLLLWSQVYSVPRDITIFLADFNKKKNCIVEQMNSDFNQEECYKYQTLLL